MGPLLCATASASSWWGPAARNGTRINAEEGSERGTPMPRLTLHHDRYDWEFVPAQPTRFTDFGMAPCE